MLDIPTEGQRFPNPAQPLRPFGGGLNLCPVE